MASGCERCTVYALRRGQKEIIDNVYGWRAEDVYRDVMGLISSRPAEVLNDIDTLRRLDLKALNGKTKKADINKIREMKNKLSKLLNPSDPIMISLELKNIKEFIKQKKRRK